MKKIFILFVILALSSIEAKAQCPILITDADGIGGAYNLTLSSNVCASFPNGTSINIKGANEYQVADCTNYGDPTGPYVLELSFNDGTPVVLANNASVSFSFSGLTCSYDNTGNPIALSVELIEFKGTPSVSGNVLTWTTASEVNNKGFEVEASPDPSKGGEWRTIGFKTANNKASTYQFLDNSPLWGVGGAYYRLKQVDYDDKFEYSKVISITQIGKGKGLKIYPNPVSNTLTIEFGSPFWGLGAGDFQILNLLGQQVLNGQKPTLSHRTPLEGVRGIDVSALPKGTYILKVGVEQAKFVKQ